MVTTPFTPTPPTRLRVSQSRGALLAWMLWGLSLALLLGFIPLFVAVTAAAYQTPTVFPAHFAQQLHPSISDWVAIPSILVTVPAFATLGALIVTRHPENRVGWLFCVVGLLTIVELFAVYYAIYTLWVQPGSLPGGLAAAWVQNWTWVVSSGLLGVFLPLLYPTGRILSRRWGLIGWLSAGVMALLTCGAAFHPGPLFNYLPLVRNPLGIEALGGLPTLIANLLFGLLLLTMLASAISLLLRWRRTRGEERLQIKWFAFVGAILVGLWVLQGLVRSVLRISSPTFDALWDIAWYLAFAALPLATGLAILTYRLYDIDLIINRTLVYGVNCLIQWRQIFTII
jgi:two-component system NarL family sensor kinase